MEAGGFHHARLLVLPSLCACTELLWYSSTDIGLYAPLQPAHALHTYHTRGPQRARHRVDGRTAPDHIQGLDWIGGVQFVVMVACNLPVRGW